MPHIQQLPPAVVNKIAAGEVIERPSSIVKELLENSLDAGARRVEVSIEQGGSALVRIADDGCGIAADELHLAVASHATSKIRNADDLFSVATLGFRGEALASIAEVSQFRLRSRPGNSDSGAEIEVVGGRAGEIAPCGCPVGTTVEVRNLFYNTPVRRKFLRAVQTEMAHISEAFTRIALARLDVHFTLRHNDRVVHELPPADNWKQRIAAFFGPELAEGLMWVESSDDDIRLFGYVADPKFSRANNRLQYLFLNGRHIRDRALGHALGEAYRGLLLTGRYPITFLNLQIPASAVDVNVHPAKLEVRFQDSGRIYSQLLGALRKKFLTSDLTAVVGQSAPQPDEPAAAHDSAAAQQHRRELVDWASGALSANRPVDSDRQQAELQLQYDRSRGEALTLNRLDRSWPAAPSLNQSALREPPDQEAAAPAGSPSYPPPPHIAAGAVAEPYANRRPPAAGGVQLHNRYLVTENAEGIVVIDQHALHERILYEQLREKVLAGNVETQQLLVPEPVSLTPSEAAAALESRDTLAELGICIEPFGGDTVLISAYPAMLANLAPAEILRQVVEHMHSSGKAPQRRDLLDELLHMVACKAAIKAGDRLAPEEITALLEQRHLCQDSHHCPHGRPTALVFTREELDKRFKRI